MNTPVEVADETPLVVVVVEDVKDLLFTLLLQYLLFKNVKNTMTIRITPFVVICLILSIY